MRHKLSNIMLALVFVFSFTACTEQENNVTEPVSTNTHPTSTTSATQPASEATTPTDATEWISVGENIYDISSLADSLDALTVTNILLEQRLFVCMGENIGQLYFVPFDLDKLCINTQKTFVAQENWLSEYSVSNKCLLFHENSWGNSAQAIRIYDLVTQNTLADWTLPRSSIVGIAKDQRAVLIADTDENVQRIYLKNVDDGLEEELLIWNVSDKTEKPTITMLVQGEKGFAFVGWIYPSPNAQSVMCYGLIDYEGNLITLKQGQFDVSCFRGGIVLYDTTPIYGSSAEQRGLYTIYSADSLSVKEIIPETSQESAIRRIEVSENGKYILTGNSVFENGCFRIYDTEIGQMIAKFECGATTENPVRQMTSISEGDRAFVVVTLTNTDTQIYYFQF